MLWLPTDSAALAPLVELPPDRAAGPPKLLPSTLNCTVPVGVPEPGDAAATVAVQVTGWPETEGFADDDMEVVVTAVVVTDCVTVWTRAVEVLARKLALPA